MPNLKKNNKSQSRSKAKSKSKTKTKNKVTKKKNTDYGKDSIITKINEKAEMDIESLSEESDNDIYDASHYLNIGKSSSKNTFDAITRLTEDEINDLKDKIMNEEKANKKYKEMVYKSFTNKYVDWFFELKAGFNLLFYGIGSKIRVLDDFAQNCLLDGPVTIIHGFYQQINVNEILQRIYFNVKNMFKNGSKVSIYQKLALKEDICQSALKIASEMNENVKQTKKPLRYKHIYVVIHNIDSKAFRKEIIQKAFSILGDCNNIHIIASYDHCHTFLLWNRSMLRKFHWCYHEVTTYEHYKKELEFETPVIDINGKNKLKLQGIEHILKSMTPNNRDVLEQLASHQLEYDSNGCSLTEWRENCIKGMLINNELDFQHMLTEFKNQNLVIEVGKNRQEPYYKIPLPDDVIQQQILDYNPE